MFYLFEKWYIQNYLADYTIFVDNYREIKSRPLNLPDIKNVTKFISRSFFMYSE